MEPILVRRESSPSVRYRCLILGLSGGVSHRVHQPELREGVPPKRTGVATAAGDSAGCRVVATVGQAKIDAQLSAAEDDLLLGQRQERRVDAESARLFDAGPGRKLGQRLEGVQEF